jgi:hypothetical protein
MQKVFLKMPYDNVRNQYHGTLVTSTLIMLLTNVEMFSQKNQLEQNFVWEIIDSSIILYFNYSR